MKQPAICYARRGALSLDFQAFMDALQAGAVCFKYLKMPARGKQYSNGIKTAYGTLNRDYIDERYEFKTTSKTQRDNGLVNYWDFDHERTSAKGNGWGGFYVDRWLGWYPQAFVALIEDEPEEEE